MIPISGRPLREARTHLGIPSNYLEHRVPYYRSYESGRQKLTRPVFQRILNAIERFPKPNPETDSIAPIARWKNLLNGDIRPVRVKEVEARQGSFDVYDLTVPENHTFVANGMIVHNTTMTDSLLSGAGLLSPSLAGTALAMDFMEEEQKRQMTIKAANVSLYYEHGGTPFVINLIDTPGHVDFSGKVTRSLRSEEHTSELQSQSNLVCRLLLEKK